MLFWVDDWGGRVAAGVSVVLRRLLSSKDWGGEGVIEYLGKCY